MKFFKFPIVPVLFGFIFGILTQNFLYFNSISILVGIFFSVIGFGVAYFLNAKKKFQSYFLESFVLILSLTFGMLSSYLHREINAESHFSNFLSEKNIVQGIVSEKLKSTIYYDKFILKTDAVNQQNCSGKIIFYIPKKAEKNVEVGNKIKLFETPKLLQNSFNPHQFDYSKYLQNQNVFHEVKLKETDFIEVSADQNFYHYINLIKSKLLKSYQIDSFKSDNYNLLMALLFGEKTELSKELSNSYTQAGIIHILAISGLHIALIYGIVLWLTKPLQRWKKGKVYIFLISLSVLWFYAVLAGFSASIVRAAVMFSIIAFAKILNRQSNIYNSLALSAMFLLLYNPNYLFDVGFQLSFAAVLSIVVFQPFVRKYSYSKYYVLRETKSLLLISLVAQIGVLPLTLYYFGQFPLLFLVANLIAIPLSSVILILGLALIPFNFLLPKVAVYLSVFVNMLIDWMNNFTAWIVQFESFIVKNIAFHEVLVVLLYGIIGCLVYFVYHPKIKNLSPILVAVLIFQMGYFFLNSKEKSNHEFVIFNVMKHNLFVETKNNISVFYTDDSTKSKQTIESYTRGKFVKNYRIEPVKNVFAFKKNILCIDSLGIYNTKQKPEVVVLTQSPKINLKRLIAAIKPLQIIADGSNYKSYIKLWKVTCEQEKIPFHATAEKGFYRLN
ncbi:ComEC/Rec2 family competence protein [Flavobacterium terrigena]|uniref:Competence protein ComEC n=1 Tax=Flavobacterium terrigena TaxID=402734 RepID=A0A1H6T7Y6_9FLAO|nr:ComEC/Rec2 family competence protein [Flavobacterium terrigena]SEI72345.1 competence protein ComEC [Flavobacterium terrigena]